LPAVDEDALVAAVCSGDATAAAGFYHRVRPQVDATIARMLYRGDADAEDVAQLALIELVRTLHRFRAECSLDTWVFRVTAHVVCKHIRRRSLERRVFDYDESEAPGVVRAAPRLVARDLLHRVQHHVARMGEHRALPFLLHDVCGFDLRETARILDVSVAAAQKRLTRGRREIRERIQGDPELAEMLIVAEGEES
jgi:RNA polymerase sigma-70 factor (ECF subfamily)